jgi:DNA-binding response OmpR family regulator
VGNLLRRCGHGATASRTLCHGPFAMDPAAKVFLYFGSPVELTRPEFDLMAALVGNPQRTFTRNALIGHIYNDSHPVTDRSVDSCVKRIRQKLQSVHPDIDPIRTVYGMGYQLGTPKGARE